MVYPKGSTLLQRGDLAGGLYILKSGKVRVLFPTRQSQMQLLSVVEEPGTVFGLSAAVSGQSHIVTVEAATDARAAFIARDRFFELFKRQTDFARQILFILGNDVQDLYNKVRRLGSRPGRRPRPTLADPFEPPQKPAS